MSSDKPHLNQLRGRLMYLIVMLDACGASEADAEQHAFEAAKAPADAISLVIDQLAQLRGGLAIAALREMMGNVEEVLG